MWAVSLLAASQIVMCILMFAILRLIIAYTKAAERWSEAIYRVQIDNIDMRDELRRRMGGTDPIEEGV